MSKYYPNDRGQYIYVPGEGVFQRVGLVAHLPDSVWTVDDLENVQPFTYDDPDVRGKTVYTAEEDMVSYHILGFTSVEDRVGGVVYATMTTPAGGGVIRTHGRYSQFNFHVNGILVQQNISSSKAGAQPYELAEGDYVEIISNSGGASLSVGFSFLPFTYPIP